jgi:DNA-binding NtrC family response regulator
MARILVIDDDPQVRCVLRDALEMAGHEVSTAPDGRLGVASHRASPADLVVTDIIMPEQEGLESILELRQEFPGVRIIAISGGGPSMKLDFLGAARHFGACRTFQKPFPLDDLVQAVREELERPID